MNSWRWLLLWAVVLGSTAHASECFRVNFEGKGIVEKQKMLLRVAEGSDSESDYELEGFVQSKHSKWVGVNLRVELIYREPCLLGCKVERFRLVQLLDPSVRPRTQSDALGSRMPVACPKAARHRND